MNMTEMDHKQEQDQVGDDLDRVLDAVLAKYAAVEPRSGLEERILANLSAERPRHLNRSWWHWGLAGAAAALLVVGASLALRPTRPTHPVIANHPSVGIQAPSQPETQIAKETGNPPHRPEPVRVHTAIRHRSEPATVEAKNPRLEVFPSPQPLSEQEKILASYVTNYPERAALLAEARMEALRRDAEERRQLAAQDQDSRQ